MTNLPVVREDEPTREIATADTDSWIGVASDVIRLANLIAPTEFVPVSLRDSAPATAAAILYGREVGLPPMTALTQTHVIEGKPAMSAEAMRALVLAAGHEIEIVDTNRARCEVRGRRHGREKWTTVVWSIDEVKHLLRKDNWQNYPRQMLQARATAELCRLVFPDVIHGFRATEEFDDYDETAATPALPAPGATTVRRAGKKAAAKKTAPPPLEPRQERPELSGPPLPGEDGYQETSAGGRAPGIVQPVEGVVPEPPAEAQTTDTSEDAAASSPDVGEAAGPGGPPPDEPPAGDREGEAPEPAGDSEEEGKSDPRGPRKATRSQLRMIFALLKDLNDGNDMPDEDRHDIARVITGRPIESFNDLTHDNASAILDTLGRVKSREELDELLAATSKARADLWNQGDRS